MKNSIILLVLGTYKTDARTVEGEYEYNDGVTYKGTQTADAPTRCLVDCAQKDGNPINKIFCIVSKKVYTEVVDGKEKTAYELFIEENVDVINSHRKDDEKVEVIPIFYDFIPDSTEKVDDFALYIYQQISSKFAEIINGDEKIPVYIDYTGGPRDVSFLMTSIIRYLQFIDVDLKKIIYSKKQDDELRVCDIDYIYNMYELINGVSEFVNTGNAWQLKSLYEKSNGEPSIHNLINSINDFSETLRLCALARLESTYNNFHNAIIEFEKEDKVGGMYSQMFKTLLGIIKNRMPMGDYKGREYELYPELIKWCVQNGMLQQALTIYTEKMPIYYLNVWNDDRINEIVDLSSVELSEIDSSVETKGFYSCLYDNIYNEYSEDMIFKNELKKVLENNKKDLGNKVVMVNKSKLLSDLKKLSKKSSEKYRKILDYVIRDISTNYDNFGKLYGNRKAQISNANELKGYVNALPNSKYINSHLEDLSTYEKKIRAIDYMLSKDILDGDKDKQEYIARVMEYYLAVKILRNRVNHASEKEKAKDNETIKCMKEKYGIEIGTNTKAINKLLLDALNQSV